MQVYYHVFIDILAKSRGSGIRILHPYFDQTFAVFYRVFDNGARGNACISPGPAIAVFIKQCLAPR